MSFRSSTLGAIGAVIGVFGTQYVLHEHAMNRLRQSETTVLQPASLVQEFDGACGQAKMEQLENSMTLTRPAGCKPKAGR